MVNDNKKYFIYNGKKSSDFDVWASGLNIFHSPERRVERIQVPGRNGELLIEDGSFENVELEFKDCFIPRHFSENFTNLSNYLNRQKGYQRLELSWLPDEYRLAAFHGDIESTLKNWDGRGKFDLTFNCKPQRFLKSGEEPIVLMNWASMSTAPDSAGTTYGKASAWIGIKTGTGCVVHLVKKDYHESPDLTVYVSRWKTVETAQEYEELIHRLDTQTENVTSTTDLSFTTSVPQDAEMMLVEFVTEDTDDLSLWDISIDYVNEEGEQIHGIFNDALDIINPTGFATNPLVMSHQFNPFAMFYPGLTFSYQNGAGDFVEKYEIAVEWEQASQVSGYGKNVYFDAENQYAYCRKASSSTESGYAYTQYSAIHIVDKETGAWTHLDFPNLCEAITRINYEPSETWVWNLIPAVSDNNQPYEYIANGDTYKMIYPRWFTI